MIHRNFTSWLFVSSADARRLAALVDDPRFTSETLVSELQLNVNAVGHRVVINVGMLDATVSIRINGVSVVLITGFDDSYNALFNISTYMLARANELLDLEVLANACDDVELLNTATAQLTVGL